MQVFQSNFYRSIIFRAFQGAGGSGIYALSTIMVPLMVPPDKFATYIAIVTSIFAFSSVLGPLLGGAITDNTTWRWVFFLKWVPNQAAKCQTGTDVDRFSLSAGQEEH